MKLKKNSSFSTCFKYWIYFFCFKAGCKSKNDIIDGEASNGYSSVLDRDNSIDMNNSGEWFCDVWAEDYDK